jgi:hypothetical protein
VADSELSYQGENRGTIEKREEHWPVETPNPSYDQLHIFPSVNQRRRSQGSRRTIVPCPLKCELPNSSKWVEILQILAIYLLNAFIVKVDVSRRIWALHEWL